MSTEIPPTQAGPSNSRPKKMVDGREETREERKARKEVKRSKRTAETTEDSRTTVTVPGPSSQPEEAMITQPAVTEKKSGKKEKKRKRGPEDGVGLAADTAGGAEIAGVDGSGEKEVMAEALDPAEEKRAKKAARKAKRAAEEAEKVQKSSTNHVDARVLNGEPSDPALSDHARKAIQYVKSHAASHLSIGTVPPDQAWKFNKANQNWLIRNVWNESEVPEEYVDDVMRYLNTIKGGGRTALIEMAEKCAIAPIPETTTNKTADVPVETADPKALESISPADATSTSAEITAPEVSPEEAKRDREVIRARAEKLLDLLRA